METYLEKSVNQSDKIARHLTAQELKLNPDKVEMVLKEAGANIVAERLKNEVKQKVIEDKVPLLCDIVGNTLEAIKSWSREFISSNRHLDMSVSEAKQLTGMVKDMNELIRLEKGQSTQNIGVLHAHANITSDQATQILTEYKALDPLLSTVEQVTDESKSE
ncbi:hypothetical protein [uncultured Flavobacterium sp.]|uniref:hypothetical protein n=1 Tax=uncultured Flavobacterium sp. TaxID=165435 RepID=UPI002591C4FC|nr:hypothetical protein [uncultured Flavobacterium sp.]